jgi:hypothetical protein
MLRSFEHGSIARAARTLAPSSTGASVVQNGGNRPNEKVGYPVSDLLKSQPARRFPHRVFGWLMIVITGRLRGPLLREQ